MKLDLGSHGEKHEGYLSVDLFDQNADIKCDAATLPYEDNTIEEIRCFHLLEHYRAGNYEIHLSNPLNPKTAKEALTEWKRVLIPGGKLHLKLPDLDKIIWLYINFPQWAKSDGANPPFCNASDWLVSNGQHQLVANKNSVERLLRSIDFTNIEFIDPVPRAFIDRCNLEMEVVCIK